MTDAQALTSEHDIDATRRAPYATFLRDVVHAANLGLTHVVRLTSEPRIGESAGTLPDAERTVDLVQQVVDEVCNGPLMGAVHLVSEHPTSVLILTDEDDARRLTTTWLCGGFGKAAKRRWDEDAYLFSKILKYVCALFRGGEEALPQVVYCGVLPPGCDELL